MIDTDKNGELDEKEFAEYIGAHARLSWLSSSQVRGIFDLLDPNHSGRISCACALIEHVLLVWSLTLVAASRPGVAQTRSLCGQCSPSTTPISTLPQTTLSTTQTILDIPLSSRRSSGRRDWLYYPRPTCESQGGQQGRRGVLLSRICRL